MKHCFGASFIANPFKYTNYSILKTDVNVKSILERHFVIIVNNGLLAEELLDEEGRPRSRYPRHSHQPEPYVEGWRHGVKLEDCSGVTLVNNTITGNAGSGVDCVNARDILLTGNVVTGNEFGVSVKPYDEGSFYREFSPLDVGDASASSISAMGNIVEKNEHDWYVDEGCTVIELTD